MFEEIEKSARERFIPVILDDSKEELLALVKKIKPKRILEIGTAIYFKKFLSPTTIVLNLCGGFLPFATSPLKSTLSQKTYPPLFILL